MVTDIKLVDEDPTIFARCDVCCKRGLGVVMGPYFSKAYPRRKWVRGPLCDNCSGIMTFLFEVV